MHRLTHVLLAALFVVVCATAGYTEPSRIIPLATGITTNTTTAVKGIPAGLKTIYGQVVGTGSVTQTQALYGDIDDDAANGVLLCTITLSGTTRTQDACPPMSANFAYYYLITTNTTGTGATGAIYAMY